MGHKSDVEFGWQFVFFTQCGIILFPSGPGGDLRMLLRATSKSFIRTLW